MIDPKTLHIGSHVMVDGVRARVIRIDEPKDEHEIPPCTLLRFKALANGKWYDCGCSADSDKVEPIPITAELLTELGFTNTSSTRRIVYTKGCEYDGMWVEVRGLKDRWEVFVSDNDWDGKMVVRYLHELEAFLYLTTKTELIKE